MFTKSSSQQTQTRINNHGGQVLAAAKKYQIPISDWLDLSTGINPNSWPLTDVPKTCWQSLPDEHDDLNQAAQDYYQCDTLLPLPGSQAGIQILPRLRSPSRVLIRNNSYAEYARNWRVAGHQVTSALAEEFDSLICQHDIVVVINPDNPSGDVIPTETLLAWRHSLHKRGGWLIVDEAFVDVQPEKSMTRFAPLDSLIILRSLGKFFGLAGLRSGVIIADQTVLNEVENCLGPWAISHPSRWLSTQALRDTAWQEKTRITLHRESHQLKAIITPLSDSYLGGTALFQTLLCTNAKRVHHGLAESGILTRLLDDETGIRFGLPGSKQAESRLLTAVSQIVSNNKV